MRAAVTGIRARAFTIPTDRPEADGTLAWNSTTLVVAFVEAGGKTGFGYTYASRAAAALILDILAPVVTGGDAFDIPALFRKMQVAARNLGVTGQVAAAISAVDTALWDLKAQLLGVSLADLMGVAVTSIPVYGSGGFTTYDAEAIDEQVTDWLGQGIAMAKIKVGTRPEEDPGRVAVARAALGEGPGLFVDANGAYTVAQAQEMANRFYDEAVTWFEEPVSSDNLSGLKDIRDGAPPGMAIAAGEYADTIFYTDRMLQAGAVDVLQLDATRCQGYTGFIQAAQLALARNVPVSSHCAPSLHLPVCCHLPHAVHMEYFYDHTRIEAMLFDGVQPVKAGRLRPFRDGPGAGLVLKEADAERFAV